MSFSYGKFNDRYSQPLSLLMAFRQIQAKGFDFREQVLEKPKFAAVEFADILPCLKTYQGASIIARCLYTLMFIQRDEKRKYPHWKFLVLIKWAYQFADDAVGKPPITDSAWEQLLNDTEALETAYSGISFKDHRSVRKSFRIMAFQQFAHQDEYYNHIFSRQVVLYLKMKTFQFDIATDFQRETGMSILAFLRYWHLTVLYFHLDHPYELDLLDQQYVEFFRAFCSQKELHTFLRLVTIQSAHDVAPLQKLKLEVLQLYETNCFITKPLLYFQDNIILAHQSLLVQTAKHFIYTFAKSRIGGFAEELGNRMEAYLELGLKDAKIPYQSENDLKREYGTGKVVDYMIEDLILVECKATELSSRSGVIRTPEVLAGDLRTSIVKAYIQLIATAARINPQQEWFGVIVTYKEMYLGFGDDAWEEFMSKPVLEALDREGLHLDVLPAQNLFFMDLEDWDYAMQVVKNGTATVLEILLKGRELNQHPNIAERVFMMEQVLRKHFAITSFDLIYLKEAEPVYRLKL